EALNDLGVVSQATGDYRVAAANYLRALELQRTIGSRLGEAEVLNNLGELSLMSATPEEALTWYEQALAIAKGVASLLEEARALEGLGRCQFRNGRETEAAALLGESLTIYQRIGSPHAKRVVTALRELELWLTSTGGRKAPRRSAGHDLPGLLSSQEIGGGVADPVKLYHLVAGHKPSSGGEP